jgi:hypothetical protein
MVGGNLEAILSASELAATETSGPTIVVELNCEGEWVGTLVNGRWLHRPCRHKRCTIGDPELGARSAETQRYHVYDVVTGDIVRSYERYRERKQ